jgi:hypothetical protein
MYLLHCTEAIHGSNFRCETTLLHALGCCLREHLHYFHLMLGLIFSLFSSLVYTSLAINLSILDLFLQIAVYIDQLK